MSDPHWPKGVAAPAVRALAEAGFVRLEQLDGVSRQELEKLHGMGQNALARIEEALGERGLSLK